MATIPVIKYRPRPTQWEVPFITDITHTTRATCEVPALASPILNLNSTLLTSRELLDHFYLGAFLVLLVCVTFNPVPPANILFSFHYVQHECYD